MPWCEKCSQFREADVVTDKGECPKCSSVIVPRRKVPWHFKILLAISTVYLSYRAYQGVMWLGHHF